MRSKLGGGREIKKLVNYLHESESVERMTTGQYGNGRGLVVLTDQRLFFVKDGVMSQKTEDFPMSKVTSIQWSSGMLQGNIVVFASGNKAEIKAVDKVDGKEIVDLIRARLSDQPHATATSTPAPAADDPMEQLRKLGDLRTAGVLSEEEFSVKKAEILSRI
jgi:hypothetical protein